MSNLSSSPNLDMHRFSPGIGPCVPTRQPTIIIFMTAPNSGSRARDAYRFDSFEVRVRARILHHGGQPLDIQELPFQMLLALLERPGEMVTKEELGDRLWGQTFVEVDKSLYVVAAKLRDALGDDVKRPRFIKTVSGRGYRFIGNLTPVVEPSAEPPAEPAPPALLTETREPDAHRRSWHVATVALLAIIALAAIGTYTYRFLHRPLANDRD